MLTRRSCPIESVRVWTAVMTVRLLVEGWGVRVVLVVGVWLQRPGKHTDGRVRRRLRRCAPPVLGHRVRCAARPVSGCGVAGTGQGEVWLLLGALGLVDLVGQAVDAEGVA